MKRLPHPGKDDVSVVLFCRRVCNRGAALAVLSGGELLPVRVVAKRGTDGLDYLLLVQGIAVDDDIGVLFV